MLSLAVWAILQLGTLQTQVPEVVRAYHGARLEYVFISPIVIRGHVEARPTVYDLEATREYGFCEWYGPRLDGTTVQVCNGNVVAVALGSDVRTMGGR